MPKPKRVSVMPSSGQFVMIWEHNRKVWSDTLRYQENNLQVFNDTNCDWLKISLYAYEDILHKAKFFILGD